jgi:hypothetical protein
LRIIPRRWQREWGTSCHLLVLVTVVVEIVGGVTTEANLGLGFPTPLVYA